MRGPECVKVSREGNKGEKEQCKNVEEGGKEEREGRQRRKREGREETRALEVAC